MGTYKKQFKAQMKDINAWIIAVRTGFVTKSELDSYGISDGRKKWMCNADILKPAKDNPDIYVLTTNGKKLMEKSHGVTKCYNYQSYNHCFHLHDKYMALTEQEQSTWKTESEVRLEARHKMQIQGDSKYLKLLESGHISSPDCVYMNSNGQTIAFEVITKANYRQEQIDAKFAMCQYMNYEIETKVV